MRNIVRAIGYDSSKCGLMSIIEPQKGPAVAPDTGFAQSVRRAAKRPGLGSERAFAFESWTAHTRKQRWQRGCRTQLQAKKKTDTSLRQFSSLRLPCHVTSSCSLSVVSFPACLISRHPVTAVTSPWVAGGQKSNHRSVPGGCANRNVIPSAMAIKVGKLQRSQPTLQRQRQGTRAWQKVRFKSS